jgi:hypothetical protein
MSEPRGPGTTKRGPILLRGRDLVRVLALVGQVAVVLALWELFSPGSQIGIGFLYALPVGCCGWWYGRRAGIEMAAACLAIYLLSAAAADVSMLALTGAVRGIVFLAAGLAAGQAREISLRGQDVASDDPAEILKLANRAVHARTQGTGEFVTVVCVAYHPSQPLVRWASAGHPLPIVLPGGRELEPSRYAVPLGLDRELKVTSQHAPLGQADAILLYSDGLYEARGHGQLFGLDRVMAVVSAPTVLPAAEIIANLRAAVLQFADRSLTDDICIVVMRRSPNPAPVP